LTDAPDAIFASGRRVFAGTKTGGLAKDGRELRVIQATPFKGGLIVHFEGITDRTSADSWRDRYFLVPEEEVVPPGDDELFIHELVGMRVERLSGEEVGTVKQVMEFPQGLMLDIQNQRKKSFLLPFNDQTVKDVDSENRLIRVDPIEGLLD
jgi:16S rRNA processing protein RimM